MAYTLEQQKENRKKWVKALRSRKYKQTKNVLFDGAGYCCLGVLARVAGEDESSIKGEGELSYFPDVCDFVGLSSPEGKYKSSYLAKDNDDGKSFRALADIIESEPPGLFAESV